MRGGATPGRLLAAAPLLAFAMAPLVAAVSSCGSETLVLATVPETDAGAPASITRCSTSLDCPADSYCQMDSCSSVAGTCQIAQTGCQDENPVCGCDEVTYFNDCLRQQNRIVSFTPGECQHGAARCGGPENGPCPAGAACFFRELFRGPCQHDAPGSCWMLPSSCPTASGPDRWNACEDPTLQCVDTCTAIRSGATFHPAPQCP